MTNNALEFKNLLEGQNYFPRFSDNPDTGDTSCLVKQDLSCGAIAEIFIDFSKNDCMVHLLNYGFIKGINPLKKQTIYEFLNELNSKYTYIKFLMRDNGIDVEIHYIVDSYSPQTTINYLLTMIEVMNDEYENFMKLIWS